MIREDLMSHIILCHSISTKTPYHHILDSMTGNEIEIMDDTVMK